VILKSDNNENCEINVKRFETLGVNYFSK